MGGFLGAGVGWGNGEGLGGSERKGGEGHGFFCGFLGIGGIGRKGMGGVWEGGEGGFLRVMEFFFWC